MCTFLESLTPKHREMLVHFYEKLLEIDPSYAHAIEGLINIHKAGETFSILLIWGNK
jgi:hypothetical protein